MFRKKQLLITGMIVCLAGGILAQNVETNTPDIVSQLIEKYYKQDPVNLARATISQTATMTDIKVYMSSVSPNGVYLLRVCYMNSKNMIPKIAIATYGAASRYGGSSPFTGTAGRIELTDTGAKCGTVINNASSNASSNSLSLQIPRASFVDDEYIYSVDLYGSDTAPELEYAEDITPWSFLCENNLYHFPQGVGQVCMPSIPGSTYIGFIDSRSGRP
jgi:hypothetical protein